MVAVEATVENPGTMELEMIVQVLGTEGGSSIRAAGALNPGVIPPTACVCFSKFRHQCLVLASLQLSCLCDLH